MDATKEFDAVIGARMMGGGFGGCTINLIKKSEVNEVIKSIEQQYNTAMGIKLKVYGTNGLNGLLEDFINND